MTIVCVTDSPSGRRRPTLIRPPEGVNGYVSAGLRRVPTLTRFASDEYDAREMPSDSEGTMVSDPDPSAAGDVNQPQERRGSCPTCRRPAPWRDNPQRPFCSFTCRLIDLGVWLDEGYVVTDDAPDDDVR
jgi:uncharacterized protein